MPIEKTKYKALVIASFPALLYVIFYNILSLIFFHETDFLASLFGGVVFWILNFLLHIAKAKVEEKEGPTRKRKKRQ